MFPRISRIFASFCQFPLKTLTNHKTSQRRYLLAIDGDSIDTRNHRGFNLEIWFLCMKRNVRLYGNSEYNLFILFIFSSFYSILNIRTNFLVLKLLTWFFSLIRLFNRMNFMSTITCMFIYIYFLLIKFHLKNHKINIHYMLF